MYSRTFGSDAFTFCPIKKPKQIPALMAVGRCCIPPDAALEQSSVVFAFDGKILLLQTIAVLCTDGRVQ